MYRGFKLALCALYLSILSSCAYMQEGSNQNITFMTPEAYNARCDVVVKKIRYQVWPPQTINIKKSEEPMRIECNAPGNRSVTLMVYPELDKKSLWGTPLGMAWDHASSSLYYYPSVIAIDFTNQKVMANPPPAHNSPDIRQPEAYDLEEISTEQPRLNADRYRKSLPLLKRGEEYDSDVLGDEDSIEPAPSDMQVNTESDMQSESSDHDISTVIKGLKEEQSEMAPTDPANSSMPEISPEAGATDVTESQSAPVVIYPE